MTPAPTSSHATETTQVPRAPAKVRIWQMTTTEWLICGEACLGFAFDTYTLLVLTLIVRPSLTEMLQRAQGLPFSISGSEFSFTFRRLPGASLGCWAVIWSTCWGVG